jgi:ATP-dependent Clp protease adaptor protein ClpS
MSIQLSTGTQEVIDDIDVDPVDEKEQGWNVVVWDDPVNTMQFVIYVFRTMFRFSMQKATMLMLQVHNEGKAVVATEALELAERYCATLHEYGLLATVEEL